MSNIKELLEEQGYYKDGMFLDHEGNEFKSFNKMCEYWNIDRNTFKHRIKKGWNLRDALINDNPRYKGITDNNGNTFKTLKDCYEYYKPNITYQTFQDRMQKGWALEDALASQNHNYKICRDYEGNEFNSELEMCQYYNINVKTFRFRIQKGWTLKDALTKNKRDDSLIFQGIRFENKKKLCEYYGVKYGVFRKRLSLGWTLEDALSLENNNIHKYKDDKGNEFNSLRKLCEYYNIIPDSYKRRLEHKWNLKDALNIPENKNFYNFELKSYFKNYKIENNTFIKAIDLITNQEVFLTLDMMKQVYITRNGLENLSEDEFNEYWRIHKNDYLDKQITIEKIPKVSKDNKIKEI